MHPASPRHARVVFQPPILDAIERERARFKHAELAPLTILSYEHDWRVFTAWCEAAKRTPLPASTETVEFYVVDLLLNYGRKVSTLQRHAAGIHHMHRQAGLPSPRGQELRELLAGAKRILCQLPTRKDPLQTEDITKILEIIGSDTPIRARNAAVLLVGYSTSLRRSSLARLRREDITFTPEGLLVDVRQEKQDRKGNGRQIGVPNGEHAETCPVRAVQRWLAHRGDEPGPLFCHARNGRVQLKPLLGNRICQLVQEAAAAAGLDRKLYGGHSLRAGFVTEALENGANEVDVARQTGHADLQTLAEYFRGKRLFRSNACSVLGL